MKKFNYLFSIAILAFLFTSVGCDSDDGDGTPATDIVGANLSAQWNATSVTLQGQNRTADYDGTDADLFVLTLGYTAGSNGGTYNINTGGPIGFRPFDSDGGTWSYADPEAVAVGGSFTVTRDDGLSIVVTVSDEQLQLTFTLDPDTHDTSRSEAVDGRWDMTFAKQQ